MNGTVVGVLRGGPSREHEVSLKSGHAVVANLPRDRFTVRDIYIDKQGQWYERGRTFTPVDILRTVDVVVNALHGEYGEDGQVQRLLEQMGMPYTGSDSYASSLAMHKVLSKDRAKEIGIKTPKHRLVDASSDLDTIAYEITRTFHQPVVVKPLKAGSSVGVSIVSGYTGIQKAVSELLASSEQVLIEEYIRGIEATSGVVEGLRGEALYGLPTIEIVPPKNEFFSYDAKYSGKTLEICPGRFSKADSSKLAWSAAAMHKALGLRHYSRSDFIVTPRDIYYLETNTLPGLTKESLLPKSLSAVGVGFPEFLTHLVDLALAR
jgi:D-alanine-D-alanine ligase